MMILVVSLAQVQSFETKYPHGESDFRLFLPIANISGSVALTALTSVIPAQAGIQARLSDREGVCEFRPSTGSG